MHQDKRNLFPVTCQNLATLVALSCLLPLSVLSVVIGTTYGLFRGFRGTKAGQRGLTVMLSGGKMTKALQLARLFHLDGYRVVLCETHKYRFSGHRFSSAVDAFYTLPAATNDSYAERLAEIATKENADFYVPVCSPTSSIFDSLARSVMPEHCKVIHPDPSILKELDDKFAFAQLCEKNNLRTPKSYRITDPRDVLQFDFAKHQRPFILKSIRYDAVRRLDLTLLPCETPAKTASFVEKLPISRENPWVLQEFIQGEEYCTHSTIREGTVCLHCCCESSPFQVNYQHVGQPEITDWISKLAAVTGVTGQLSFDFIRASDDGEFYAIECNPRTHSAITTFHDHAGVANAYLGSDIDGPPIEPLASSKPTHWTFHELWRLVNHLGSPNRLLTSLKGLLRGKDAIFDWRDPLPFLFVHHLQIPTLLLRDLREQRGWKRIDFNIGKLVQAGGD